MKINVALILVLLVSVLSSCVKDNSEYKPYYNSYGTVIDVNQGNFSIELDNGDILIPELLKVDSIANDDRVLVGFYVNSELTTGDVKKINAKVEEMYRVLTLDVLQLTEENTDTIGSDGIFTNANSVWLSRKHLNVNFMYYGGSIKHNVNLVKPIGEQLDDEGNQILELRHNAFDERYNQQIAGVISFNMENLHEEGIDSISFAFRSYDYDSVLTELKGTYHFKDQIPQKRALQQGQIISNNLVKY